MDYSSDYNNLPDEDLEERDAIGQLAEENAVENELEQRQGLEDEAEEAREVYELKKLMGKYSDKVIGILKELNEEHIRTVQELEKPTFTTTKIGGLNERS